jgi:dephospho-CoA kinase
MLKIGLTGGIASGKSIAGKMFAALGAHVAQADRIAHQLMLPGEPVYNQVVGHFGRAILNRDGSVNRAELAKLAFGSPSRAEANSGAATPSRIEELNRIVHPAVLRAQEEWLQAIGRSSPHAVAIVEAALIIEAGAAKQFDRLIVVACSDEQRIARFAARQKVDLETARKEVARRMAAQLPEAEKAKMADYVIDNSGSLGHTREQVQNIWAKLQTQIQP